MQSSRRIIGRSAIAAILAAVVLVVDGHAARIPVEKVRNEDRVPLSRYLDRLQKVNLDEAVLADSAIAYLRRQGYLDASVIAGTDLIGVNGGTRYELKEIVDIDSAQLVIAVDRPFTPSAVASGLAQLVARIEQSGYYYASAQVERVDRSGSTIEVFARVNRGPKVMIGKVKTEGLKRTDPDIAARYLATEQHPFVSASAIAELEKSASRIPFLRFIPPARVLPRAGYTEADIALSFRERKQVRLSGGVGYLPDDPVGLIWDINLSLVNLRGNGQSVDLISKRTGKRHQTLDLSYRRPVFWKGIGALGIRLATRDFRDQFYEFLVESDYSFDIGRSMTGSIALGWKRVDPSGDDPNYSRGVIGVGLTKRSIDDVLNPRSGWTIEWKMDFAHRRYRGREITNPGYRKYLNETRSHLRIESYHPIAGPVIGAARISYDGLETAEQLPPNSEMILIGGPGTIRGFRTEQFAAVRAVCGSLEPRLRFDGGYLFGFVDGAWMQFPSSSPDDGDIEDSRFGYGGGLTVVGEDRSLRLSLGWNKDAAIDQPWLSVAFLSEL